MSINAKVGQTITLGSYPQSDVTGQKKDPIEWKVLKVDGDKALVVSVLGLDNVMFNSLNTSVTWATAEIRPWLNGEFMNAAFTADEQAQIVESTINTTASIARRPSAASQGCGETVDKIFCLSREEVEETMPTEADRTCVPSAYCKAKGAFAHASNGNCWWWLRTPDIISSSAVPVYDDGSILYTGDGVTDELGTVRPAMWIDLTSD